MSKTRLPEPDAMDLKAWLQRSVWAPATCAKDTEFLRSGYKLTIGISRDDLPILARVRFRPYVQRFCKKKQKTTSCSASAFVLLVKMHVSKRWLILTIRLNEEPATVLFADELVGYDCPCPRMVR